MLSLSFLPHVRPVRALSTCGEATGRIDSAATHPPRAERVVAAWWGRYDSLITVPGCDKNMPGCLIAMARVNVPSIMVYGGTTHGHQRLRVRVHASSLRVLRCGRQGNGGRSGTLLLAGPSLPTTAAWRCAAPAVRGWVRR